ncbi:MAG: N-acyl homoserine lactonase family protein [Nitrospira sp.]|nr:N-acyl homoserine lactonase family protein [Nitrospira sp.]
MTTHAFDILLPSTDKTCEIYALKLGEITRDTSFVVYLTDFGIPITTFYYVWCIKGSDQIVLVDTGFTSQVPQSQVVRNVTSPVDQLAKIGIDAREISTVVISHLHWDHAGGHSFFPNATFYIQKREFEFFTENPLGKYKPFTKVSHREDLEQLVKLKEAGQVKIVDGAAHIAPGISIMLAPGHTPGLQVTLVNTARGIASISSDCGHLFRNFEEEIPSSIITDMVTWLESYRRIKGVVSSPDLIFPGHDALMISRYPNVAEGVSRLV